MNGEPLEVHVHYDDHQDDLILDAVGPLFDAAAADSWFVRHWRRGPHLRLTLRPHPGTDGVELRGHVRRELGAYLARRPSRGRSDPHDTRAMHQRLAVLECDPGPVWPWVPDNSILDAPHDDRAAALGGPAGAELFAQVHLATDAFVRSVLDDVRGGGNRMGHAFDLVVASVQSGVPGGARDGFVSCRSHAEAFLSGTPEGPALRTAWERHSATVVDRLADRVVTVVGALDGTGSPSDHLTRWVDTIDPLRRRGETLLAAGRMSLPVGSPAAAGSPDMVASEFHRVLALNTRWHDEVLPDPRFGGFRLALNWTYLQLTRLGISPVERFRICHLVADAVERAYGVDAVEMIRS